MLTKSLKGKDYISLMDYSREELETILEVAMDLKKKLALGEPHEYLKNKTLGMIFANPSTRTRTSFEAAMTQLGGHAQFHTPEVMQIAMLWLRVQKFLFLTHLTIKSILVRLLLIL
jgi:ornithine carbamoyltransferase